MAQVSLFDKVGAMAHIDNLRHQQLRVRQHLDLTTRRNEVEASIREYYRANGIDVNENLIEQGVREYFSKRLQLELPALSGWQRRLAMAYVRRDAWLLNAARYGAIAIILATLAGVVADMSSSRDARAQAEALARQEQVDAQRQAQDRQLAAMEKAFEAIDLSPEDKKTVGGWLRNARLVHAKKNLAASTEVLAELESKLVFIRSPLTLSIIDRPGVKAGMERTHNESRGKSWFLVVEALDDANGVVSVPYRSIEDDSEGLATKLAVRVTQDMYLSVKKDKQTDGHIDKRVIGTKAGASLRWEIEGTPEQGSGFIGKWADSETQGSRR